LVITYGGATPTTVTLQQGRNGYTGAQDTYLYMVGVPSNYCTNEPLKVGWKQQYAPVLRFGLASIPTEATVTQATLQVYANGTSGGGDIPISSYYISRTVESCQATWFIARTGVNWGTPGANNIVTDRRPDPESSLTTSGINKWYSFDLTAVVQGWVNGSLPNNGVLLRQTNTLISAWRFPGAQNANVSLRPKLVISYVPGG
jgi:hypothetical protein